MGFAGLPQPLADAFKLLAKEIAKPSIANRLPYFIAPIVCFLLLFFSLLLYATLTVVLLVWVFF